MNRSAGGSSSPCTVGWNPAPLLLGAPRAPCSFGFVDHLRRVHVALTAARGRRREDIAVQLWHRIGFVAGALEMSVTHVRVMMCAWIILSIEVKHHCCQRVVR